MGLSCGNSRNQRRKRDYNRIQHHQLQASESRGTEGFVGSCSHKESLQIWVRTSSRFQGRAAKSCSILLSAGSRETCAKVTPSGPPVTGVKCHLNPFRGALFPWVESALRLDSWGTAKVFHEPLKRSVSPSFVRRGGACWEVAFSSLTLDRKSVV